MTTSSINIPVFLKINWYKNSFLLEVYKKRKEDIMIKVNLN
ncbi:hypothetical protein NO042_190001 [Flavobacterium psychrophilum]|nr:hypothetical protein NO042_190001 [Flavobacterium psychrophilum]